MSIDLIEDFCGSLLEETYTLHEGHSGMIYARFSVGRFRADLLPCKVTESLAVLVTNTSPCLSQSWADVKLGMTDLFDAADLKDIILVGHPFYDLIDGWLRRFPFLLRNDMDELRYIPGSRGKPSIVNHELQ